MFADFLEGVIGMNDGLKLGWRIRPSGPPSAAPEFVVVPKW